MVLKYKGKDITNLVEIAGAVGRDNSRGACDSLELTFENAAAWYSWKPEKDDEIELILDGYSTGKMYLNTILPEKGKYTILATAIPSAARRKLNMSYENMAISDIAQACAIESAMGSKLWGIDRRTRIGYITRNDEGSAAFLERIARMEGCVLKCWNGIYTFIGIENAQMEQAKQCLTIDAGTQGTRYTKTDGARIRGLRVVSPYGSYEATDDGADGKDVRLRCDLPVNSVSEAVRWAKGLLLAHNRMSETLSITSEFNIAWTAMARIDVNGTTDANGAWVIDGVTHDFINRTSEAECLRVINTIR